MNGPPFDPKLREAKELMDLREQRPGENFQLLVGAVRAMLEYLISREQRPETGDIKRFDSRFG